MTLDEFVHLLDRYGADLEKWPASERGAAQALLNQGPGEAWKQYRAAQLVEQLLNTPVPATDHQLMDRILAATQYQPEGQVEMAGIFSVWQRGVAATAICLSLLAGLMTGWSNPAYQTTQAVASAAEDAGAEDVGDIPGLTSSIGLWGDYQ